MCGDWLAISMVELEGSARAMTSNAARLLIVGASVRAAAYSAGRAGFSVEACDLFGDADLQRCCPTTTIEDYPRGFITPVEQSDCDGWLYTGGLENYPRLVERLARSKPLLGNRGETLRRVRDPAVLARLLVRPGMAFPEWRADSKGLPMDGTWLCKGRRSSGGLQVARWTGDGTHVPDECYFQRYVPGTSASAVYVAAGCRSRWLGVSRQLIGSDWHGTESFRYAGSIATLDLHRDQQDVLATLGELLAEECRLEGLFGVDFVLRDRTIWPIEVNPRLPASVEVLERAAGFNALACHVDACTKGLLPTHLAAASSAAGKAIVYAHRRLTVDARASQSLLAANDGRATPIVADIPCPGTTIEAGMPIATVLADEQRFSDVEPALRARLAWLESVIYSELPKSATD